MACSDTVQASCSEMCRMERELRRLVRHVEMKKQQFDQACLACQELLQPQSRNFQVKEESEDLTKATVSALLPLDSKEEAEVKLINDLLSRAQITRSKVERKYQQLGGLNRPAREQASAHLHTTTVKKEEKLQEPSNAGATGNIDQSASRPKTFPSRPEKAATANTTQLSPPFKDDPDFRQKKGHIKESKEQETLSAAASQIKQPVKNLLPLKHSKICDTIGGMRKMVSHSASRHLLVKPAHATAPFKTDPNIPVAKRNQLKKSTGIVYARVKTSSQRVVKERADKLSLSSAVGSKAGRLCDPSVCVNKTSMNEERNCEIFDLENEGKGGVLDNTDESATGNTKEKDSSAVTGNTGSYTASAQQPVASLNSVDCHVVAGNSDEQELFTLQSDGSSIKIPANLRKEYARNHELRIKLLEKRVNPRADTAKQNFISKLEKKFNGDEKMVKHHRLWYCRNAFKRLGALLENLKLDQLTESSPAEEVIRAKHITEFILSSFTELSQEAEFLSKEHFEPAEEGSSNDLLPDLVEQKDLWSPPHIWLPQELQGEDPLPSASVLEYSTVSELCQYMGTLFEIQNLRLQIHLNKMAMSELVPLLESMDPQHPDYPAVFRGVYAFLTSNGQHLPTFVHS